MCCVGSWGGDEDPPLPEETPASDIESGAVDFWARFPGAPSEGCGGAMGADGEGRLESTVTISWNVALAPLQNYYQAMGPIFH